MADQRADTFLREQAVRDSQATPKEIGGDQVPTAGTEPQTELPVDPATDQTEVGDQQTPMIPKFRYDELNLKYQEIRNQPAPKAELPDLDRLVEAKIAPLRVQMETERVLKTYEDFPQYSQQALEQIKLNPSLSLEDGYLLAKAKSGALASEAKEQGKNEAYNNIERKQASKGESQGRKAEPRSVDDLLRDPTVPLKDIERMLPKS